MADAGHERVAEELFAIYEEISPEEWVARWAHTVGASSFGNCRYQNARLSKWIFRVHELLRQSHEIRRCREEYLTSEEIAEIERGMDDPL